MAKKSESSSSKPTATPTAIDLPVFELNGKVAEKLSLDGALWDGKANLRLLTQAMHMYRSSMRAGTASTKTRAHVSGGGRKPWKQKHTGRARQGSTRSPQWRHGGIVFGPHPRNFAYQLPRAMRRRALLESLKGKLQDEQLVVVTRLEAAQPKTKPFAGLAKQFKAERMSVIVLEEFALPIVKSLRNLASFELHRADDLNAFNVINAKKVLMTKTAFQKIEQRLRLGLEVAA